MTSDYLDRKWLEEGKWVGGRWSLLLVEDPHLPQIKIKCGVQLESAVISASLSVVLLTLFSLMTVTTCFSLCVFVLVISPLCSWRAWWSRRQSAWWRWPTCRSLPCPPSETSAPRSCRSIWGRWWLVQKSRWKCFMNNSSNRYFLSLSCVDSE